MKVGCNIWMPAFYQSGTPFLNLIKGANRWAGTDTLSNRFDENQGVFTLDSNGCPTTMAGTGPATGHTFTEIDFTIFFNMPFAYQAGIYVFLYDDNGGGGTFNAALQDGTTSAPGWVSTGRIGLYVSSPTNGIRIGLTSVGSSHPTNFRLVYSPDSTSGVVGTREALLNAGEIFDPDYISKMNHFDTIRFMDWNGGAFNSQVNWSDRSQANWVFWNDDYQYTSGTIPYEVMVAFANKVNANAWITTPPTCTYSGGGNYVSSLATLVHDGNGSAPAGLTSGLNSNLKVYAEYANEIWNAALAGNATILTFANTIFTGGHSGTSDYNQILLTGCLFPYVHGAVWKSVWGASGDAARIVVLAGLQEGASGVSFGTNNYILGATCDNRSTNPQGNDLIYNWGYTGGTAFTGRLGDNIDAVTSASYFYGSGGGGPWFYAFPTAWDNSAQGLTNAFQELETGGVIPSSTGGRTTAGTSTAYTLTSGQSFPATPPDMAITSCTFHTACGNNPTIKVDGGTAFSLVYAYNTALSSGNISTSDVRVLCFNASSNCWQVASELAPLGGLGVLNVMNDSVLSDVTLANSYSLPFTSYEGGQNFVASGTPEGSAQSISLFNKINNDPRMYDVYTQWLNLLVGQNCSLVCHYSSILYYVGNTQYWGILQDDWQTTSKTLTPKYQALIDFIGGGAASTPIAVTMGHTLMDGKHTTRPRKIPHH